MNLTSIKQLLLKYQDLLLYGIFGVLTTLVNMAAYWLLAHPLRLPVVVSTALAWVIAVEFAYLTNRKWVFHSQAETSAEKRKEWLSFFSCRAATGLLDLGCMFLFVDVLHFPDMIVKAAANVLVILLNYLASKLLVFRKKNT